MSDGPVSLSRDPSIPALISATRMRLRQEIARLTAPLGLTPHHIYILTLLKEGGQMTMHDVAATIRVDDATVSRMMSKLSARKWVRIARDRSDRRRANVAITPAGRKITTGFVTKAEKLMSAMMSGLSSDQLATTRESLQRILENLDRLVDGKPAAATLDD